MKKRILSLVSMFILLIILVPGRTSAAGTDNLIPGRTDVSAEAEGDFFTPVYSPDAPCTPKQAFTAYKSYLQNNQYELGGYYSIYYDSETFDMGRYLAFWDVTGDGIPEMLAVRLHNEENARYNSIMSLAVYTYKNGYVREMLDANGNSFIPYFWDQTFAHDITDSVCFAIGNDLYVLSIRVGGEAGYYLDTDEIYKATYYSSSGKLSAVLAMKGEDSSNGENYTVGGTQVTKSEYYEARSKLLTKAETGLINVNERMSPAGQRACTQLPLSEGSYLGMNYQEALAFLNYQCSLIGWQKLDGIWYYFNDDGTVATGWKKISGHWYYFSNTGMMQTGWRKIGGQWYWLDSSGIMATGWQKISTKWYFFNDSGVMQTGWKKISNQWYYLNAGGDMETGWKQLSGKWYYFNSSGVMQTGWQKIKDVWYFFKPSGIMAAKEWYNGYYLNMNGSWTYQYKASWKQNAKGWWFGDTSGWYAKDCTLIINDKQYTFDARGYWVK